MQSKSLRAGEAAASAGIPAGSFKWATIHQYSDKESGSIKSVAKHEQSLFSSSRGGIKRWNVATGK